MPRALIDHILVNSEAITSAFESESVELLFLDGYAIWAEWDSSGADNSEIFIQVSNDRENWVRLRGSRLLVSGQGSFMWNVRKQFYRWVRLEVVPSGGTLTLKATINGKSS